VPAHTATQKTNINKIQFTNNLIRAIMSSDNTCQRTGSIHSGRSASKVSSLLGRAQNSEHLQPLSDSTVLAEEKIPEQNHTMVKDYLDVDCDYSDLCKFLFQRAENL
jgi:hypothetical protein